MISRNRMIETRLGVGKIAVRLIGIELYMLSPYACAEMIMLRPNAVAGKEDAPKDGRDVHHHPKKT